MGRYGREAAWAFGVLGCCLAALYGLELNSTIKAVCLGVVAVGACVALAVGPSLHHPRSVRPWHMLACAAVLFVVGAVIASNVDNVARLVVFRRVSGIHPMLTLVGAVAGIRVFGPIGVFLGPLVLSYFVELLRAYEVPAEDARINLEEARAPSPSTNGEAATVHGP